MPGLVTAELNNLATVQGGRISHISLHSADGGTAGTNEISGGGYVRKPITFGAPSNGIVTGSVVFDGPLTASHFGGWTAATAGTWRGGNPLRDAAQNPVTRTILAGDTLTVNVSIPVTAA